MNRYVKESTRLMVKIIQISKDEIILEIPTTSLELHDWFKADYITSVLRNTFGEEKLAKIGDVIVVIDQKYNFLKG